MVLITSPQLHLTTLPRVEQIQMKGILENISFFKNQAEEG